MNARLNIITCSQLNGYNEKEPSVKTVAKKQLSIAAMALHSGTVIRPFMTAAMTLAASTIRITIFMGMILWGLNSCFWTHCKFFTSDLLVAKEIENSIPDVFSFYGHALYKVQLMGVVVSIARKSKHFIISVDDGFGAISCIKWQEEQANVKLGDCVKVFGRLCRFNNENVVNVFEMLLEKDVNRETSWMLECLESRNLLRKQEMPLFPSLQQLSNQSIDFALLNCKDVRNESLRLLSRLKEDGIMEFSVKKLTDLYGKDFACIEALLNELAFNSLIVHEESALYRIFNAQEELIPLIKNVIVKNGRANFSELQICIQKKYKFVRTSTIKECLDSLVSTSFIYRTGKFEYSIFS